jgi:hypothetical protein
MNASFKIQGLTQLEGYLLLYYCKCADAHGQFYRSHETTTKDTRGLSRSTVSRYNRKFRELGFLTWVSGHGGPTSKDRKRNRANQYQLHLARMREQAEVKVHQMNPDSQAEVKVHQMNPDSKSQGSRRQKSGFTGAESGFTRRDTKNPVLQEPGIQEPNLQEQGNSKTDFLDSETNIVGEEVMTIENEEVKPIENASPSENKESAYRADPARPASRVRAGSAGESVEVRELRRW